MHEELYREKSIHGSLLFPFQCYVQDSIEPVMVKNYHWHEEIEWIYTVKGTISIEIDMVTMHIAPGRFICIPSQALHRIITDGECLYYAFVYKFQFLQFSLYDFCENAYMIPLERGEINFQICTDITLLENKEIKNELQAITDAFLGMKEAWQMVVKASLIKIVALMISENKIQTKEYLTLNRNVEKIEQMKILLGYIKEHYHEKIFIRDMADLLHMNETYFCRYFKARLGKTPVEYINNLRIEEAAMLIQETDQRILDICYQVGFDNVSYFIRCFKERKNSTPKQYREKRLDYYHK